MDGPQHPPARLPRLHPDAYTVGWLCALAQSELPAARVMLDHQHEQAGQYNKFDDNVYEYGDINGHNIVIACMAPGQPGILSAQELVTPLRQTFANLKLHLFVGIGGGIPLRPSPENPDEDIHLGDVVVGWAEQTNVPSIIQYNRIECLPGDKDQRPGVIQDPHTQLVKALSPILADRLLKAASFEKHLDRFNEVEYFEHPGLENDLLFEATYNHNDPTSNLRDCSTCDTTKLVKREPRKSTKAVFHQGTILSDNSVMKNPLERDRLSDKWHKAICIEMEASGIMKATRSLIIRGIADYADTHKNQRWQPYAAGAAAAFAREVLFKIPPVQAVAGPTDFGAPNLSYQASQPLSQYSHSQSSDQEPRNRLLVQATHEVASSKADSSQSSEIQGRQFAPAERRGPTASDSASISTGKEVANNFNREYDYAEELFKSRRNGSDPLQSLKLALEQYHRAEATLRGSTDDDPDRRRKIYFRLAQVKMDMTYPPQEPKEIAVHLDMAEEYIEASEEAARKSMQRSLIDHVRFERSCIRARKLELRASREPIAGEVDSARKDLETSMQRLKESDWNKYLENCEYGGYFLERLKTLPRI